jgi:AcrR family transcriptional regulator
MTEETQRGYVKLTNSGKAATSGEKTKPLTKRERQILNAAEKMFARYGYYDTEMDMIAELAGISKGTIYNYFDHKKDLFLTTLTKGLEDVLARINESTSDTDDPVEKLETAIEIYMNYFKNNERLYEILFQHRRMFKEVFQPEQHKRFVSHVKLFQEIIVNGINTSKFRKMEPSMAAWAIVGLMHAAIHRWLVTDHRQNVDKDLAFIKELLFNGIKK